MLVRSQLVTPNNYNNICTLKFYGVADFGYSFFIISGVYMKYVFKLLNQPNTDLNLNLDDLYIGEYQKSITGDLVIKINSNVQETESYDFLIPTDKAEKLYTWQ
jgi:hypothetical protein